MKQVNCRKCKYFYVTWDQNNPYGCKYFGFKTKTLPSVYVYKSSGEPCKAFLDKNPSSGGASGFGKGSGFDGRG